MRLGVVCVGGLDCWPVSYWNEIIDLDVRAEPLYQRARRYTLNVWSVDLFSTASNTMISFMVLREAKRRRCMLLIFGVANRPDPSRNQGDYEGEDVGEGGGSEADMHGLSVSLTGKECFT